MAASTATAAAAKAASTATTAAAALGLRAGFVDHQIATAEVLAIEGIDRAIRFLVIGNLDEGESPGLPGETVADEIDCRGGTTGLREKLLELLLCS